MSQPTPPRPGEAIFSDTTISVARAAAGAAEEAADLAATRHAQRRCRLAGLLVAALLPSAATLVFDRDEDISAETTIALVHIRAAGGALLWYDPDSAFAAHPDARALRTPPVLDGSVLDEVARQLRAAYDATGGHFDTSDDGAEVMLGANLLVLTVAAPSDDPVDSAGREVVIEAPGREEHHFVLAGDDTVLVLVDGEPTLGIDREGPGRWCGEVWQRLHPAGQLTERQVSIEGITNTALWQDLAAALGLDPCELGRFKPWAADAPKHLSDRYDLDAAVAWARRHGLTYEDQRRVRVVAGTRRQVDDGLAGRTVHVLEWDRGEHGVHFHVRASRRGAVALRDALIREHWDKVSTYEEVPDQPPADPTAALRIWEATNHNHADPDVGIFTVAAAVIAD